MLLQFCIANLVIGTFYCSRGDFNNGLKLIIDCLDPIKEKLGTDTWFYSKRCIIAYIEKALKSAVSPVPGQ